MPPEMSSAHTATAGIDLRQESIDVDLRPAGEADDCLGTYNSFFGTSRRAVQRWLASSVAKEFPSTRPVAQAHPRGGLVVAFEYGFCRGYQELELAVPAIKGAVWFNRTSR
jgi:hypothetical protein